MTKQVAQDNAAPKAQRIKANPSKTTMARQAAALHDQVVSQFNGLPKGDTSPVNYGGAGKRRDARGLYWQGWKLSHISEHLGIPRGTLHGWLKSEKWNDATPTHRVECTLEARLVCLIMKEQKTGGDFKEIDLLSRQAERLARIGKYETTGREVDLNPNIERRNAAPKKQPSRNFLTDEHIEQLKSAFLDSLFKYQLQWWHSSQQRTRSILKSRQIGATWYFAREALIDALETGRNQIFLSASKSQAHIFKQYITSFVYDVCGVELKGDPIVLANGATLYFLGSNARTAQGYHGNFYFDEFFWTTDFERLNKVASGMAMHKKWRKTYFSTPSSIQHAAYAFWSGERLKKKSKIEVDITHAKLATGFTGEDRMWRNIVTIVDALNGGCDLFDLAELQLEYSDEEFANLLMCGFVDDSFSVFPMSDLQPCMVDSWEIWKDFKQFAQRPLGYAPVWIGYDPSQTGDSAGLVVVAPPAKTGGSFRVLETLQFKGADFEAQADAIKKVTQRYNVEHITIDTTGIGAAVHELVRKFYPRARGINYSVDSKTMLVLKGQQVIRSGRLEFDADKRELMSHLMSIKRELTPSGRSVTYSAGRSKTTGHADLGWSLLNALSNEPLDAGTDMATSTGRSFITVSD
ncbi:terminase [Diaphorobacter sp. HDW4A]|uniref:terminase large subunit domain-containing protein n=1 Tax=Diaphorobacter sp. HDW4A TaxID=2714924 RepID=UPI00140CF34A|nr:terminase family protein [Diaphorobacter sp. HDW4A]QIL80832.1 terminase [Diaphorobacter sp. HDW4A]QIL83572.1 terminase [Diaphorobacter sp. HDW4A]